MKRGTHTLGVILALVACGPATSGSARPPFRGSPPDGATLNGHLERDWTARIEFAERGGGWDRCDFSTIVPDRDGGLVFAASARHSERGTAGASVFALEREHALFRASRDGRVDRIRLGDKTDGRIVYLAFEEGGVLAATRREVWVGSDLGPDTRVVLSLRDRLGTPAKALLELDHTRMVFPLDRDRWLAVGALPPHSSTIWSWGREPGRAVRSHPEHESADSTELPLQVFDVDARAARWAARGKMHTGGVTPTVSVFGERAQTWHAREGVFVSTALAFDAAGNLWLSGWVRGVSVLGDARFPRPLALPSDVRKTYDDLPPPGKGHIRVVERRIYSLFGFVLRKIGLRADRTVDPADVTDGVLLRYDPQGRLTLMKYFPAGALVWPGPLLADGDGVTAVIHVEGWVPESLRRDLEIDDGFTGVALLVHLNGRGDVVWVQPLGHGERIVKQLTRTSNGYALLAHTDAGQCELSRWTWSSEAGAQKDRNR